MHMEREGAVIVVVRLCAAFGGTHLSRPFVRMLFECVCMRVCAIGLRHIVPGLALGTAAFVVYTAVEIAAGAAFPSSSGGHHHDKH